MTNTVDANGQRIQMDYDLNGNQTELKFPEGNKLEFKYDSLSRLENTLINGQIKWSYYYDNNGNLKILNDTTGSSKEFDYFYNNLLKEINNGELTTSYEYKGNDFLSKLSFGMKAEPKANHVVIDFEPTANNQVFELKRNGKAVAKFDHSGIGNIKQIERGNNAKTDKEYNGANRLENLINFKPSGEILNQYYYEYDNNYNVERIITPSGLIEYDYDALNQLKMEKLIDGTVIIYDYDAVGNRIEKTIISESSSKTIEYVYDNANQLDYIKDGLKFEHDKNGNLLNDGIYKFIYNELNQLISVTDQDDNQIAFYTYDFDGKRTSIKTINREVYFHYHGDMVIYETDSNGNILVEYTWDEEGNPLSMFRDGQLYYYFVNGHGDVVALTDEAGIVVASYDYDAWGNILLQEGELASINPYRYAGYRYDKEVGLYYLMSRYYNPDLGRFITRDSFQGFEDNPLSLNLYTYSQNNPVIYIDPDGYHPILIALAVQIVRGLAKKYGKKTAANAYNVLKPWLKKVRDDAKNYDIRVQNLDPRTGKFQIAILRKGISTPVFRLEMHYERGKWELHYHVYGKRILL